MTDAATLVSVRDLRVQFGPAAAPVRAVDGVSFDIASGETVALVGESGCGKSVTALSLTRLVPGARYGDGSSVRFRGEDVLAMGADALRRIRGAEISYVFQEPGASLNPVFRAGYQVREAIRLHRPDADDASEALELIRLVGLPSPERIARAYPHELSGGMQQRIMIAMALACRPNLLIADEPTTALDVTIQAQILELLQQLQRELRMAVLLITHNLGLVADVAHRVNVMYAGRIVESGPTHDVLRRPLHPYTRGLLNAVPRLSGGPDRMPGIDGAVPNPARLPAGCSFHPRCSWAAAVCREAEPGASDPGGERSIRCHFWKSMTSGSPTT